MRTAALRRGRLDSSALEEELRKLVEAAKSGAAKPFGALVESLRSLPPSSLRELLAHEAPAIRRAALLGLRSRLAAESALLPIVNNLSHDGDPAVRRTVAELLEVETLPPVEDALENLLHDENEEVRVAAMRAAKKRPPLLPQLVTAIDEQHEDKWRVRQTAAQSLEAHASKDVVLPLLVCLATDTSRAVCQAAAATLESFVKVSGWPASIKPEHVHLESAQTRVASYGAGKHPALTAWLEKQLATDVDLKKLREFGQDLTVDAEEGRIPRAYGVDDAVEALKRVLLAGRGPRAAVLLGEPGSGKTAVINELAHRIKSDGWRVLRFTPVEMLAGTKYLGEWQTKLNELMRAAKAPRKVILYCPNLEELSEAGRTAQSDINMATALAPRIEAGELAIVGESTPESFRAGLGAIGSLRRLFHAVEIKEKTADETRAILEHMRRDAKIDSGPQVIERLIELADYYLSGSAQPGRAAGLFRRVLDGHMGKSEPLVVRDVLKTLSASTGVPIDLLDDGVALDLANVRGFFESRVMGQPEATDSIVDVVALVKAGLTDPGKPFGVFLFVGPTGVGKTELARALAEYLFGDVKRMVRFDMSEFATYDAYERLIGRGDRPGLLTAAVRERPFSVLLFDEIEKAHANVFDLCLQLFDAGRLTDAQGRTADFRRTIIVMTSNVGSRVDRDAPLGFSGETRTPTQDSILRELTRFFRPEFLNRLDRIVTFRPLAEETAEKIARREVARVVERSGIARRGLVVDVDPAALSLLLREGYSPSFGARPLKRTVEKRVLLPVARAIAAGGVLPGSVLRLVARGDQVEVELVRLDGGAQHAPPRGEERKLEERAASLSSRIASLRSRAAPLASRKAELLALSGGKGFWNDHGAARATLDEVHRLDGVLSALDALESRVLSEEERVARAKKSEKDVARLQEKLDALDAEASRVSFLVECRDARELGDAYVMLSLVKSTGPGLDGVEKLANMYAGLAQRRGLEVEVLNDRRGGDPHEDTVTLLVSGAGAFATLSGESGLHQLILGRTEGRAPREDRDVVRIDVLPAPLEADFGRDEIRAEARSVRAPRGRLLAKPNVEVHLLHVPTMTSVRAWTEGDKSKAIERLRPLLRACVDHGATLAAPGLAVVRRYTLGPSPLVRDPRTGRSTGRLEKVLEGDLDLFLSIPREATA